MRRLILSFVASGLAFAAFAIGSGADRDALEEMLDRDQTGRAAIEAVQKQLGHDSEEEAQLWKEQAAVDHANLAALDEIVAARGWPKLSVVGQKAATAAFLVVQHAPLDAQQRYLPLLRAAVALGEAKPSHLALLVDRIRVRTGEPQVYGTQLSSDPGADELRLHPIEDESNVDQRRIEAGLEPLADYLARFGIDYVPQR